MLRIAFSLFFAALLALSFDSAFSQQPSPTPRENAQVKKSEAKADQQPSAKDQRGSKKEPLVIEGFPSEKTEAEKKKDTYESEEKPTLDRVTAYAAGAAAGFAFLAFGVACIQAYFFYIQLKLIRQSLAPATEAADAARAAAKHIPRVERAYVFMLVNRETIGTPIRQGHTLANSTNQGTILASPMSVEFSFENQGRTPAIIREISAEVHHWDVLPGEPPVYESALGLLPTNRYLASGKVTDQRSISIQTSITYAACNALIRGDSFIWFFGRIVYDDVFGDPHEHAFIWRYGLGFFLPYYGNDKYIKNT